MAILTRVTLNALLKLTGTVSKSSANRGQWPSLSILSAPFSSWSELSTDMSGYERDPYYARRLNESINRRRKRDSESRNSPNATRRVCIGPAFLTLHGIRNGGWCAILPVKVITHAVDRSRLVGSSVIRVTTSPCSDVAASQTNIVSSQPSTEYFCRCISLSMDTLVTCLHRTFAWCRCLSTPLHLSALNPVALVSFLAPSFLTVPANILLALFFACLADQIMQNEHY